MNNNYITLTDRINGTQHNIFLDQITLIKDNIVGTKYGIINVKESTQEIMAKIAGYDEEPKTEVKDESLRPMTSKEIFAQMGIDSDKIFEEIFGFGPNDSFEEMAAKLAPPKKKKKVRKTVRTPFGPISTWEEVEE